MCACVCVPAQDFLSSCSFFKENAVKLSPESDNFLVTTSDRGNDVENSSNQQDSQDFDMPKKSYRTIISMIAGSLVENGDTDVHEDHTNQEESPM